MRISVGILATAKIALAILLVVFGPTRIPISREAMGGARDKGYECAVGSEKPREWWRRVVAAVFDAR